MVEGRGANERTGRRARLEDRGVSVPGQSQPSMAPFLPALCLSQMADCSKIFAHINLLLAGRILQVESILEKEEGVLEGMEAGADWVQERRSGKEIGLGMYTVGRRPRKGPELKLLFFFN